MMRGSFITHSGMHHRQRGFAVVSVLLVIIVLSLIGGSLLQLRTSLSHSERDFSKRVKLEMAARAGINLAILGLTDTRAEKRWRVDGIPTSIVFNEISLTLAIQDESGRVDVNLATRDTLDRLFQSVGLGPDEAAKMADRILDWRESNNLAHLNGSTDEDYRASGGAYRPRHKPFQDVDELKMVLGMTPDLFQKIRPALTVYSQSTQINQEVAPKEALLTLQGMSSATAETIINDRLNQSFLPGAQSTMVRPGVLNPLLPLGGRSFTIRVLAKLRQTEVLHEQVIRITNSVERPFLVLKWR